MRKKKWERKYGGVLGFLYNKMKGEREDEDAEEREREREVGELGNQVKTNGAAGLEVK